MLNVGLLAGTNGAGRRTIHMSEQGSGTRGRRGPIVWGGLALLTLVALGSSVFLSNAGVTASERDAVDRAEDLTASIVASELTRELVLQDITGEDYRRLLVAVQAGILSDDQVVTVRVWRTDGNLLFSTAQRDEPGEVVATDDPQIQAAAGGEVVSVLSTEIEPRIGLRRPSEELLQTYVPVSLLTDSFVEAVVEIDQRYGAIRNDALTLWRPVQILLAVGLVLIVGGLVRSLRRSSPALEASAPSPTVTYSRADDRVVREAKDRVQAAERRAKEAEERLREREQQGAAAPENGALEELELKLRAADAEREQHIGEIQRLRAALAQKDVDLALARDGNGNTKAEAKRANKLIAEADGRAGEAEQKAAAAERRAAEAAQRAVDASGRALEMEAQVRALEEKLSQAATTPEATSPTKRRDGAERKTASELKRSNDELTKTKAALTNTLAELEAARARLGTTETELGSAQGELGTAKDRLSQAEAERDAFRARMAGLEVSFAEAQADAAARASAASKAETQPSSDDGRVVSALEQRAGDAERRLADSEERFADAQAKLGESDAQLADALARLEELDRSRSNLEGDAASGGTDLSARIAELEKVRRADIQELHRVQESFANTQVEFTNTTKKLREAERRIRELEGDSGVRRPGVPTYAPVADHGTPEPEPVRSEREVRPVDPDSFEDRVSSLRAGLAAANDLSWDLDREAAIGRFSEDGLPPMPPEPQPDALPEPGGAREPDAVADPDEEGLSLRERLARAAAARHRGPLA